MEIGAIFLVLAVCLLVGLYVFRPFFEPRRGRNVTVEAQETSALLAERDRVIQALQELDFDYQLQKIPTEEYPAQRAELLQKGAGILKQLDALAPSPSPNGGKRESLEDRVEQAVAARRAERGDTVPRNDDEVEALIASRRAARKVKSGGFCPRCGKPILASDRFCPHCGKAI